MTEIDNFDQTSSSRLLLKDYRNAFSYTRPSI